MKKKKESGEKEKEQQRSKQQEIFIVWWGGVSQIPAEPFDWFLSLYRCLHVERHAMAPGPVFARAILFFTECQEHPALDELGHCFPVMDAVALLHFKHRQFGAIPCECTHSMVRHFGAIVDRHPLDLAQGGQENQACIGDIAARQTQD